MIAGCEDRRELYAVAWLRCVIEVAVSGVNSIVREIIEHHDISRNCLRFINPSCVLGLLVNTVWQIDAELRINEKHVSRAVNTARSLASIDIWRSN